MVVPRRVKADRVAVRRLRSRLIGRGPEFVDAIRDQRRDDNEDPKHCSKNSRAQLGDAARIGRMWGKNGVGCRGMSGLENENGFGPDS